MKKKIFVMLLVGLFSTSSCLPTLQYLQYLFGGYTYNVPQNADWWSAGWNNYYSVPVTGPFSGNVYAPMPNGFTPNRYNYRWNGNQCFMTFWNQHGATCQRTFNWRNGQFYWLR